MNIQIHTLEGIEIAELQSESKLLQTAADGLDLLGNLYYQGYNKIILHEANISDEFFELKSGMAGEVLQKFSNYRVQLAIVGDFSKFNSKSLDDFIYESNQGRLVGFVTNLNEALQFLSRK